VLYAMHTLSEIQLNLGTCVALVRESYLIKSWKMIFLEAYSTELVV